MAWAEIGMGIGWLKEEAVAPIRDHVAFYPDTVAITADAG